MREPTYTNRLKDATHYLVALPLLVLLLTLSSSTAAPPLRRYRRRRRRQLPDTARPSRQALLEGLPGALASRCERPGAPSVLQDTRVVTAAFAAAGEGAKSSQHAIRRFQVPPTEAVTATEFTPPATTPPTAATRVGLAAAAGATGVTAAAASAAETAEAVIANPADVLRNKGEGA